MKAYVVTHGAREFGFNPDLTIKGTIEVRALHAFLPKNIPLVVIGTGQRFWGTYNSLGSTLQDIPVAYSPFCGSPDGLEKDGTIALTYGMVQPERYLGLIVSPCFDAWKFITSQPEGTLFCAGGELMLALGLKSEKGHLYELDTETRTAHQVA